MLQHITEAAQRGVFEAIDRLAGPDAVLALTFAQGGPSQRYALERVAESGHIAEEVDRAAFESYAEAAAPADEQVLPVRFISPEQVAGQLELHGWNERARWDYHVASPDSPPALLDDYLANASRSDPDRLAGRDLMMTFVRQAA